MRRSKSRNLVKIRPHVLDKSVYPVNLVHKKISYKDKHEAKEVY